MTEADYWVSLAFHVCREIEGMEDRALRSLWCDGFIPEQHLLDDPTPRVTGARGLARARGSKIVGSQSVSRP